MRLDGLGRPQAKSSKCWSAIGVLALVFLAFIILENVLSAIAIPKIDKAGTTTYDANGNSHIQAVIPGWVIVVLVGRAIVRVCFFAYVLALTIRTRAYIRKRYEIQEANCTGYEDCCTSFW